MRGRHKASPRRLQSSIECDREREPERWPLAEGVRSSPQICSLGTEAGGLVVALASTRCSICTETGDPLRMTCSPQGELLELEPLVELLRERLPQRLLSASSQSSMAEMSSSSREILRTRRTALSGRTSFGTIPDAVGRGTCQLCRNIHEARRWVLAGLWLGSMCRVGLVCERRAAHVLARACAAAPSEFAERVVGISPQPGYLVNSMRLVARHV